MLGTRCLSVFKEFQKIKLKIFVILFVLIFLIETKVDIETSECLKLFEWKPESKARVKPESKVISANYLVRGNKINSVARAKGVLMPGSHFVSV